MTKERIIIIFGIIFTLVWATKVPFLFPHPFQPQEGIKRLSQEASQFPKFIQESVGIDGLQAEEIEKNLLKEIRFNWIVSTLVISLGCFAGYLLVRRKKSGRLIAIALSSFVILYRAYGIFTSEHWKERLSFETFSLRFQYFPIRTVQEEITYLVLMISIVLLMVPSFSKVFESRSIKNMKT